jgi:hypothetical protein
MIRLLSGTRGRRIIDAVLLIVLIALVIRYAIPVMRGP